MDKLLVNKEYYLLDKMTFLNNGKYSIIEFGTKVRIYKIEDLGLDVYRYYFLVCSNKKIKSWTTDQTSFYSYTLKHSLKINKALKLQRQAEKIAKQIEELEFN